MNSQPLPTATSTSRPIIVSMLQWISIACALGAAGNLIAFVNGNADPVLRSSFLVGSVGCFASAVSVWAFSAIVEYLWRIAVHVEQLAGDKTLKALAPGITMLADEAAQRKEQARQQRIAAAEQRVNSGESKAALFGDQTYKL